jgi:hypothetical protein
MNVLYSGKFPYSLISDPAATASLSAGSCMVYIVKFDNDVCAAMMTEDRNNSGPSVTNMCDRIATQVYRKYLSFAPPERIVWLEHSPGNRDHSAHIDLVQFAHEIQQTGSDQDKEPTHSFTNPRWKRFFEAPLIAPLEFIELYSFILKELCSAALVFMAEDKKGYYWRVWANGEGFFLISSNPLAELSKNLLDIKGVAALLVQNHALIGLPDIQKTFTEALMKGFLSSRLLI